VITLTFYTCPLLRIDARGASTPPCYCERISECIDVCWQLWLSNKWDFDLTDPLLYCIPSVAGYNSLNDHCLNGFMRNPIMRRRLVKHGLLTRDGHTRCSLQELNRYRDYLHRCYQRKMYAKKVSTHLVL